MQSLVGIIALGILAALEYGRQIGTACVATIIAALVAASILG
jgi:hypothetical protein